MRACHICGIPQDSGFFDDSSIQNAPLPGQEVVLARHRLHRNYCGVLINFAQFTDHYARDSAQVKTPGYRWQIRCNGQPRDPYLSFDHLVNLWGESGFPVQLRLEAGSEVELIVRNVGAAGDEILSLVGGRILGRYWYNTTYGGAPHRL